MSTRRSGLIGDPVDHSLSPYMHNAAFAALGIDARYELWGTSAEDVPARLASLREPEVLGANVTVPHKQLVMPLLDSVSESAQRIGAVNTIVPRDGTLHGENTDVYGFGRSLQDAIEGASVRRAVVVGAGGASRAVLVSLQEAGVADIVVVNRTVEKAEHLTDELSLPGQPPMVAASLDVLDDLASGADVLVNATSIGWHGRELPFDEAIVAALPNTSVVMDLTYRETELLRLASARGLRAVDGLPMLIHQGARAFELWTGETAPVDVMTAAVLQEQARRSGE